MTDVSQTYTKVVYKYLDVQSTSLLQLYVNKHIILACLDAWNLGGMPDP